MTNFKNDFFQNKLIATKQNFKDSEFKEDMILDKLVLVGIDQAAGTWKVTINGKEPPKGQGIPNEENHILTISELKSNLNSELLTISWSKG